MVLFDRPLTPPSIYQGTTLAHAKTRSHTPTPTFAPIWDVRSATESDMRIIAPRLARGSLDEIEALSRFQPLSVMLKALGHAVVITDRSKPKTPVAILEINAVPGRTGEAAFWSAMTEEAATSDDYWGMTEYANSFLQHANNLYPSIVTYVDARNLKQIAWLERVGFTLAEELPQYGRKELPFKIYIRRNNPNL